MEHIIPIPKTALAIFVGLYAGSALAYTEAGQLGNTKSWESAEYQKDWGLVSMNASTAYAMGFTGKGVNIGVMDSGVLVNHPEFQDGRIHVVKTTGTYDKDGMRYPDAAYGNGPINKNEPVKDGRRNYDKTDNGNFKKGEAFDIDGAWHKFTNDAHGTHVGGTMAASRDGNEMHGVAFESNLYSANTGGNDNMTYGPNQDYQFFLKGYTALADAGAKVINNSWGSNRRVNSSFNGAQGYKSKYGWREVPEYGVEYYDVVTAPDPVNDPSAHIYLKDLAEAKKAYYQFVTSGEKNFVDAAYEVAKNKQVIQVFTAGNRSLMAESFTRAMLPYFRPDAEKYWVNVTGQAGGEGYPNDSSRDVYENKAASDIQEFNLAGHSKWWTIAAPAENIYSAYVELQNEQTYGQAMYRSSGGTSMAAPHVSGALGVIFSRYPYMTTDQARDVMLTTARQTTMRKGIEGQKLERWESDMGVPSAVWGWGILDLGKAMFGPGQFLGEFNVSLNQDDVWSNDISDNAIKARKSEDEQEAAQWLTRKAELEAIMQSRTPATAEEKAEYQVGLDREVARNQRVAQGYEGALVKNGTGTLTLTGNNSFSGKVEVKGGELAALNQSLASAKNIVVENGAALNILTQATVKKPGANGYESTTITSTAQTVNATIADGGTFILNNGVANLNAVFVDGAKLQSAAFDEATQQQLQQNPQQTLTYQGTGAFVNADKAEAKTPYAFFTATNQSDAANLKLTVQKQAMANVARNANEAAIANAIDSSAGGLYQSLLFANTAQAQNAFDSLNYDSDLAAQQHNLVNNFMLRQQLAQPAAVKAKLNQSTQLWSSSTYHHLSTDGLSSRSYNQLLGADVSVSDNANVGAFFGATKNTHKNDRTSKDRALHLGLYGNYALSENLHLKGGFIHSWGKDEKRLAMASSHKTRSQTEDVFAEIAYNAFQGEHFVLEPYAGVSYMHVNTDGFTQGEIRVKDNKRNLFVTSVGVRPSIPFNLGAMSFSLQGDVAYHRFYNDRAPQATMVINERAEAVLYGKKLTNLVTAGVAVQANITPALSFKVGYLGAYNSDTKSNGVNAQLRYAF
ncbi:S8 family serine peptidase [Aggregatibacter actinomycetemcomitans]|nr:S8 family serine peptidase [Aggregatibacter actinomycetemcomitans]